MDEQMIVRVAYVTPANESRSLTEWMAADREAWPVYKKIAEELSGQPKAKPLIVRPAEEPATMTPVRRSRSILILTLAAMLGFAVFAWTNDLAYHRGWRTGYEHGAADARRAYGAK